MPVRESRNDTTLFSGACALFRAFMVMDAYGLLLSCESTHFHPGCLVVESTEAHVLQCSLSLEKHDDLVIILRKVLVDLQVVSL